MICSRKIISITALLFFSVLHVLWGVTVESILVESQNGIAVDKASVLSHVQIQLGDEITAEGIASDVRRLQGTGRFAFVNVSLQEGRDGAVLIYKVSPKWRLRNLKINGVRKFSKKKAKETLAISEGSLVDENDIASALVRLRAEYQKKYFPDVQMTYSFDKSPELGIADVTIDIEEEQKVKVKEIKFFGNTALPDWKLRKIMRQRKTHLFSWLTGAGAFDRDLLEKDVILLRDAYVEEGYLDVQIKAPTVYQRDDGRIRVEIEIDEGQAYQFRFAEISGNSIFSEEELRAAISIHAGETAKKSTLTTAQDRIERLYARKGYYGTRVQTRLQTAGHRATVDVDFNIQEGEKTTVRNVNITGNTRTKDGVIRRELSVYPGELLNVKSVKASEARIRNLRYFSTVNTRIQSTGESDEKDVLFEVEEQKTGQFVAGAGFSSIDSLIGFIELSQGNFDLFNWPTFTGGGQKLKLRMQLGTSRTDYELSFIEPWFLNRKLALNVNIYRHERRFLSDEYNQRNTGASVGLSKAISSFWRGSLSYGLEEVEVYDVDDTASDLIKLEEGKNIESSITASLTHDSRDKVFIPTRGNRTRYTAKYSGGPLGFDVDLYNLQIRSGQYFPLWFDHVFNLRGWYQVVEEHSGFPRVPIFDRLFVGGARTVRGFDFRDIGPRDEEGEAIGGKSSFYATAEYTIPLNQQMRFATFYDMGMVDAKAYSFSSEYFNTSAGVGMRFDIPGFPLQLDYSWPLRADEFNDRSSGRFSFLIGYTF